MFVTSMMLVSCLDTIILPDDKTVDEDFWKNKSQVSAMVNAAYAAMTSNDVLARLIVWGDFRTDELLGPSANVDVSATTQALNEISSVNIQTTNMFADWSSIYAVINRCNIVLERSEAVMDIDPNYTEGDYQVDRSQMLALRALCYFYLVRNFRDVPYITEAYMNSSQNMQVEQSAPSVVLQHCIEDLEEAAKTPINAAGYAVNDWKRVGWMTGDGINSLLADIYLWRASVTHSQSDYQQCVTYCDKVIDSKRAQHVVDKNDVVTMKYPLCKNASRLYGELFVSMNAEESIFELQCRSNLSVCQYYYKYKSATGNGGEGWLRATSLFGNTHTKYDRSTSVSNATLYSVGDMRYYAACYLPSAGEPSYSVRKMISTSSVETKNVTKDRESYDYGGMDSNCNIYRLPDVMLMKAEALVQQVITPDSTATKEEIAAAESHNEQVLRLAFELVQAVNGRSLHQENIADSMSWSVFGQMNKAQFELLVMQERLREFCFEGRRWYDLLRYNYRHIEGIDYSKTLAQQVLEGKALVANYSDMLSMMTRKRDDGSSVIAKTVNEGHLYMPIPNSDIIVCPLLRQNPAYQDSKEYEKSY